jgi:hypothetical protein
MIAGLFPYGRLLPSDRERTVDNKITLEFFRVEPLRESGTAFEDGLLEIGRLMPRAARERTSGDGICVRLEHVAAEAPR